MEWVSVEDKLPKPGVDVLLYSKNLSVIIGYLHIIEDSTEDIYEWYDVFHDIIYCVSHWMPLPEPPKEKT